jgi:type IV pilus assembly protein PilF
MNRPLDLQRLLALGLGASLAVASTGCASMSREGPQAANPERQAEAEYDLARDAFYKGHLREALDHAQKASSLDDQNPKVLYFTAAIDLGFCSAEGMSSPDCRLADAEQFARRAIKVDAQFRDARNMLGQVLILEKKYDEAIRVLEPLTRDPAYVANYLAWGNYGWAQVLSGKVDEGISSLRNAITEPRFCTGHYRLGMAYAKKGDLIAAEKSFGDAVAVPSADCQALQEAWFERARARMKLGHTAEAQGDFARCREVGAKTDTGKECAALAGGAAPTPVQPLAAPAGTPPPSLPQPQATAATSSAPQ